jgi:hypothetical protein
MPYQKRDKAMSRFITQAVFNGTQIQLRLPGNSIDDVMLKARKHKLRCVRNCKVFMFYNRKTGKLVDMRFN